jgi:hypothetical protein
LRLVKAGEAHGDSRRAIFARVWRLVHEVLDLECDRSIESTYALATQPVPHLSEPWYC